jgi:uncharacterized protein
MTMNTLSNAESRRVVLDAEVPARTPWSAIIRKGQTLRIVDTCGQQAVDTLFYNAGDPQERYSGQDTLRARVRLCGHGHAPRLPMQDEPCCA